MSLGYPRSTSCPLTAQYLLPANQEIGMKTHARGTSRQEADLQLNACSHVWGQCPTTHQNHLGEIFVFFLNTDADISPRPVKLVYLGFFSWMILICSELWEWLVYGAGDLFPKFKQLKSSLCRHRDRNLCFSGCPQAAGFHPKVS